MAWTLPQTQIEAPEAPTGLRAPAAASEGDGFERFVREHREPLVRFLCKRTSEEDAKDIAQESLVRLMRYRGQPADQLKLLMYRIAMNEFNDRGRRQQSQHAAAHVSFDQHFHGLPSADLAHEQRVANQQELARVREAILRLPDKCRQVYLLNRIEGMSYTEISRHCGISVKAVEKHIGRALVLLRLRLRENLADTEGGA
ncbi:RNA polymerase sigma factor [Lysobacter silvisoli]|uniref:RNA polymerase sigma factor n=1 Tax=Lysobacter silvisoli TaxID=2293254 RepID=A0A371K570_9GAMM|nr:RNA polymerase sigma factor [Lysobacter silvisoli]